MHKTAAICVLFMMLAVQYASCGDFLFMDFDRDQFTSRYFRLEADFDKDNDIIFKILYLNSYSDVMIESASLFDRITWFGASDSNEFLKMQGRYNQYKTYTFLSNKALKSTSPFSPCQRIAQTNDSLCLFRMRLDYSDSIKTRNWMPFYVKIENIFDKNTSAIKLYGGAYAPSNGHIANYDAFMADKLAASLSFVMDNVTTANEPNRTLVLTGLNSNNSELVSQIKPRYFYFQCPKFSKLVPFVKEEVLQEKFTINLAHLGIPFDSNMLCSFSLYCTDIHNEMNLVQIKGRDLFSVRADSRYLDWETEERDELKREYNKLVIKYNDLLKTLQNVLDSHPRHPNPRSLATKRSGSILRTLASKFIGGRQ